MTLSALSFFALKIILKPTLMNDEVKVLIEWLPGALLPVRINRYSTGEDLENFLKFSCFSDEKIYLFYNGEMLNPSVFLGAYGIRKNSVIQCKVVQKINIFQEIIHSHRHSIQKEAARRLDLIEDKRSNMGDMIKSDSSLSDSDPYQYLVSENNDTSSSSDIPSDPLPILWQNDENG